MLFMLDRKKELLDVFCFDFLRNSKTVKQITFFPALGHRHVVFYGAQISSPHTKLSNRQHLPSRFITRQKKKKNYDASEQVKIAVESWLIEEWCPPII